jgi:glycosyltransferase involved in cell wall biosynthesis
MRFVFWQNLVSLHQLAFLRELAKIAEVRLYVDELISPERLRQGWPSPSAESFEIRIASPDKVAAWVAEAGPEAIHIFAPRGCCSAPVLLQIAQRQSLRYVFLAEMPDGNRTGLFLRTWLYRIIAWSVRPELFLAMGDFAVDWYRQVGFKSVVPFGYSVTVSSESALRPAGARLGFIFVAAQAAHKRPLDFLRALACLPSDGWRATVVGDGPLRAQVHALADELGLSARIRWIPGLPNAELRAEIAAHDVLVLCSEWEGWGAVINEAIAEGTRVVASSACGSACLLELGDVGESFPARDVAALAASLRRQWTRGVVSPDERAARRELNRRIAPAVFAAYFSELMRGRTVPPPWRQALR